MKCNITWLSVTTSTNNAARALLESSQSSDEMSVIAASKQLCGRGQGDHEWISDEGKNLTFSILLRHPFKSLGTEDSLKIINTCVCPVIQEFLLGEGIISSVKAPNDIWVSDKKICGILIENIISGSEIKACIIGVGLNLNQTEFPSDLPNPVSLKQLTGKEYKPETVLSGLVDSFCKKNLEK